MLSTSSPPPTGTSGSLFSAALPYLIGAAGIVTAALIGCFGVLFSQRAPQQAALTDAFSSLTGDLQEERAWLTARISELKEELHDHKVMLLERDGEIRGLKQSRDSLLALLVRSGIPVPGEGN
jgi:hypothetical protein